MFATINPQHHSTKRRRVSNIYSKSYLQRSTDLQAILTETLLDRFLTRLAKHAESGQAVDIMRCNQAVTLDIATAYMWGLGNGTRYLLDEDGCAAWNEMYLRSRPLSMFFSPIELAGVIRFLAKFGVSPLPNDAHYFNDTTDAWCLDLCDKADETLVSGDYDSPGQTPVVYRQLKEAIAKEPLSPAETLTAYRTSPLRFRRDRHVSPDVEATLTKQRSPRQIDAAAELLDELVATNDVLGITLNYICWELSKRPEWQKRLHEELLSVSQPMRYPSATSLPSPKELDQLPVLHAIIMETMRLDATNPGQEPRLTPKVDNLILVGFDHIPAGVRVSASPYSLHRDPEVYPEPESWQPERWMPSMEEKGKWAGNGQAEKWFWGFSSGPRMCIGNHLSMHRKSSLRGYAERLTRFAVMTYIIGTVYTNFKTSIVFDKGMDDQHDGFIAGPKAEKLVLKLEPWD